MFIYTYELVFKSVHNFRAFTVIWILWSTGATLSAGRQAKDTEKQGELVTEGRETLKHIMISYQWASQKLLIQVRDSLVSNGFKVHTVKSELKLTNHAPEVEKFTILCIISLAIVLYWWAHPHPISSFICCHEDTSAEQLTRISI